MFTTVRKAAILLSILILTVGHLFAQVSKPEVSGVLLRTDSSPQSSQNNPYLAQTISKEHQKIYLAFINNKNRHVRNEDNDKKILRKKWQELLGMDIFYPYFKMREMEDWVSEKASVQVFKMKGKPRFENNQVKYIFKIKF